MNSTEEAKECCAARYRAEPNSESPLRFTDKNLLSLHRWEDSRPEVFWEKKKAALNRADFVQEQSLADGGVIPRVTANGAGGGAWDYYPTADR